MTEQQRLRKNEYQREIWARLMADPERHAKYNEYYREYKRKRREDPDHRAKYNEYDREYKRKRREDPEYRAKYNEYYREYKRKRREDPEYRAKERERKAKEAQVLEAVIAAINEAERRAKLFKRDRSSKPMPRMVADPLHTALDRICRGAAWQK